MKFLVMARWTPKSVPKLRERMMKFYTLSLEGKFLFPLHTIVGTNTSFCIIETNSIGDVVRLTHPFTDLATFYTRPIEESMELEKIAKAANV